MNPKVEESFFKSIVDAFPSPVFVMDRNVRILTYNAAAARILAPERSSILQRRAGAVLHCIHSTETPDGCGTAPSCQGCVVRQSVGRAFLGQQILRERVRMELTGADGEIRERYMMVTTSLFGYDDQELVLLIIEDISELLKAMLPICCHCKKIRGETAHWHSMEAYFMEHHNIQFSHGICPDCARKHYPEIYQYRGLPAK